MNERIFISYKREDKDVVFKIKDDIESNVGVKCWIDLDGIESDAQFVNVIINAIDEAEIFLFMYSKKHTEITDFENDWTVREINYAQTKKKRIIFLNIDNTSLSDWFVMMFGLKQQVDVRSDVAMKKLYVDLRKWLSIESDVKKEYNQESRNVAIYKIRVNRPSMLYIDDEEIQLLEANKIAKISLSEGEYWRKVVAIDDENIYDEKELILSGASKLDNIVLDCDDLDKVIKSNVDVARDEFDKTPKEASTANSIVKEMHEYVDLGLSVKWATCNVGAEKPEASGDYFAWGETKPKKNYAWSTYKYCKGTNRTMIKYCTKRSFGYDGFVDNKVELDVEDDVARVNWGGEWRMPTYNELEELRVKCKWEEMKQNGVKGYKVVGPNGNSIFLPSAGYKAGMDVYSDVLDGLYCSSSLYEDYPYTVSTLCLFHVEWNGRDRYAGFLVRPVCP